MEMTKHPRKKVMTVFGTRPEIIKLAPVIETLEAAGKAVETVNVTTGQHADLLQPFIRLFGIRVDHDLRVMEPAQTPNRVCSRVLALLDPLLKEEAPDLILVQGDTTTALAAALAGFHFKIPVGHIEAGLRSGNAHSPFPEEMNRRLITRLATYHFAATSSNRQNLLSEGVDEDRVFVTGNPVVDSLKRILSQSACSAGVQQLIDSTRGLKRLILTTHRRESFGDLMMGNLKVLRDFVANHDDVTLIFPVHPNPVVVGLAHAIFSKTPRVQLTAPQSYQDFILLLRKAWLIVSDSGGVQEEAPTLGKPLLVIRENTERPEAIEAGVARLVGGCPERLAAALEEVYQDGTWIEELRRAENPFGQGDSASQISQIIQALLGLCEEEPLAVGESVGEVSDADPTPIEL